MVAAFYFYAIEIKILVNNQNIIIKVYALQVICSILIITIHKM